MTMMVIMVVMMNMIMMVMVWKRQKLKYSSESGLCLLGMLLFWEHKVVLHLRQTHTHKVEGMQRWVCQAISALAAISIPPSAPPHRPQFSQPPQLGRTPYWDRYVTVMPTLFKCKQSRAPAHTIRIWHIICSPIPVFFCNTWVYLNAGLRSRISVCMILIFALFVVFGHLLAPFSSNPSSVLCHRPTIISSKFVGKARKNRVSNFQ